MSEVKELVDGINRTFEEFKQANDLRLKKLEENGGVADLEEKLVKMNESMDAFEQRLVKTENAKNRPDKVATGDRGDEYAKEWAAFIRKGKEGELLVKSGNTGTDSEGGYLAPELVDDNVYSLLQDESPMRGICEVMQVSRASYKQPINTHGAGTGWVGETAARPETDEPGLAQFEPTFGELYANPAATQTLLDDAIINVEAWYAGEIVSEFAMAENTAFTTGNGTNKPKGITAYTTAATADAARAYGTLEHVETTGTAEALDESDDLITLVNKLKSGYMTNARWLFSRLTLATIRKLKDGDGNYLWRPGAAEGVPGALLGYGYTLNDDMPAVAAGELSVAFGDFRRGYKILDVRGIRSLRDPYTNKPYVHFYTTKRVGGGVRDSQAIKFLKVKAA